MASLQSFIASKQQRTLVALTEAVSHLSATLLQYYLEEVIPYSTGPPWLREALDEEINNVHHASACAPDMFRFIQGEMQRWVQEGFSILLSI